MNHFLCKYIKEADVFQCTNNRQNTKQASQSFKIEIRQIGFVNRDKNGRNQSCKKAITITVFFLTNPKAVFKNLFCCICVSVSILSAPLSVFSRNLNTEFPGLSIIVQKNMRPSLQTESKASHPNCFRLHRRFRKPASQFHRFRHVAKSGVSPRH